MSDHQNHCGCSTLNIHTILVNLDFSRIRTVIKNIKKSIKEMHDFLCKTGKVVQLWLPNALSSIDCVFEGKLSAKFNYNTETQDL